MDFESTLTLDYGLTRREIDVTGCVAKGFTNKETAEILFVTDKTIKFHLTHIFKKLGVASRMQLIVKLMSLNIRPEGFPTHTLLRKEPDYLPDAKDRLPTGL